MIDDLKSTKDKVAGLLEQYPETRDCDKTLWLAYMCIHHELKRVIASGDYKAFKELIIKKETPSFESLRRNRQKTQEKGMFLGSAAQGRKIMERKVHSFVLEK